MDILIFIKGNHDEKNTFNWLERENYNYAKRKKFIFHEVGTIITENKKEYYLTHYPTDLGYKTLKRRKFHGHIHGNAHDKDSCLNVGIDSPEIGERPFGEPINWNEAVSVLEEKFHYMQAKSILNYQVVWLDTAQNIQRKHGCYNTFEEALQSIEDWWALHNYESPYIRHWTYEETIRIDYGSHTQFYEIVKTDEDTNADFEEM